MADSRPLLSVVIPSYRQHQLLQCCLKSLQLYSPKETEIIVVDDGSKDEIITRTAASFSGVRIIRNKRATGFCRAANRGIQAASGQFIQLLNDDAEVTEAWAERAIQNFDDPAIGSIAPLVLIGPPHRELPKIDSAGDHYDLGGFAQKRGHQQLISSEFTQRSEVFGASGSSAFYRTKLIQELGGYPNEFGSYFEDVDLSWRIHHAGYRTIFEPTSVVWHRVGSSHQIRRRLIETQSRNEERVFWRNVPDLRRHLLRHAVVLAGKSLRRIREGRFWPFAFGRLRAFAEIPTHLRHRQTIKPSGR